MHLRVSGFLVSFGPHAEHSQEANEKVRVYGKTIHLNVHLCPGDLETGG